MRKGFTLIELVLTIVILGIVSYIGMSILTPVIEGYVDTKTKTFLFNEAQFALERMSRELRGAIPNTIRAGNGYIQFGKFDNSSYYKQSGYDNLTYYSNIGNAEIGDNVSIYNTKADYFYNGNRIYEIVSKNSDNLTLNKIINPSSPYHRVYLISTPVTFYLQGNKIYRSFDYPMDNVTYGKNEGKYFVLADYIGNLQFSYTPGNFRHSAVVSIILTMKRDGIKLNYKQEVHIRNVP